MMKTSVSSVTSFYTIQLLLIIFISCISFLLIFLHMLNIILCELIAIIKFFGEKIKFSIIISIFLIIFKIIKELFIKLFRWSFQEDHYKLKVCYWAAFVIKTLVCSLSLRSCIEWLLNKYHWKIIHCLSQKQKFSLKV